MEDQEPPRGVTPRAPRVLAIVGTNASGKSTLGVDVARAVGGEVISADSRQIYRGLDLGTGKLSAEDMAGIPHHLIDIREPGEPFSLAEYQALAYSVINDVHARGRIPLLVGGTALYLRAVINGYELVDAPPVAARRSVLEAMSTADLTALLRRLDSQAAEQVDPRNRMRVIRLIEVLESGYRYSDTRRARARLETLQVGLTWPRPLLRERIDARLLYRLDEGMIDEVRQLIDSGVSPEFLHRLGLEYRYIASYLRGAYDSVNELYEDLRVAIWRFARRQLSWFLKDPRIHWLDVESDYRAEAIALAARHATSDERRRPEGP